MADEDQNEASEGVEPRTPPSIDNTTPAEVPPEGEEEEAVMLGGGEDERRSSKDGDDTTVVIPESNNAEEDSQSQGRCSSVSEWFTSNQFLIYTSQFLSAWGDRMWTFAVALYLVEIENNSLRLTAVFGFALTISVLIFGALVGQWVDRTPRLKAASRSLVVQNLSVILNAICLLLLIHYKTAVQEVGEGGLFFFCQVVIIVLGVVANLASVAQKICIQKDWVVILAGDDRERLAEMNATVRRIDLTVNILAPVLVGQIMTFTSMTVAGVFIASWNLISLVVEYSLLLRVYKKVPRLAIKFGQKDSDTAKATATEMENLTGQPSDHEEKTKSSEAEDGPERQEKDTLPDPEGKPQATPTDEGEATAGVGSVQDAGGDDIDQPPAEDSEGLSTQPGGRTRLLHRMANWFLSFYHGWLVYRSYSVYLAGLSLAFLYMTVMGFDSITNGYGYSMGISGAMLGVIQGLGSISGIIGTFAYPRMRQRIGLTRTGLWSFSEEILCLTLCICSIWTPGSPFNPYYYFSGNSDITTTLSPAMYTDINPTQTSQSPLSAFTSPPPFYSTEPDINATSASRLKRFADIYTTGDGVILTTDYAYQSVQKNDSTQLFSSYASPILFFTGMVTSRVGLWMIDLTVTQLIQESVREDERGIFNGMQRSLECSMDMLHFMLVIILPAPETFGYLILLSFVFICCGGLLYSVFSFKDRGHLFHPEKLMVCRDQNAATQVRLPDNDPDV